MRRPIILLTVALTATTAWAGGLDVPIVLTETAGVARVADPVSVGVPIPRGLLTDTSKLCVLDPAGKKVPAQFEPLCQWFRTAKYPKSRTSVRWVLVDFQADVPAGGKATYRLADSGPGPRHASPVRVDAGRANRVSVSTGPLTFAVNGAAFRLFDSVTLDGRQVVKAAATDGLCVEGMDKKRYYASKDLADPPKLTDGDYHVHDRHLAGYQHNPPKKLRVLVEKSGPLRTVVMIDGVIKAMGKAGGTYPFVLYSAAGDRLGPVKLPCRDESLGFRVRIHAYAGKPFVRVFFTQINLKGKSATSTDMARYRSALYMADACRQPGKFLIEALELGTTLKLSGAARCRLGGDAVHAGRLDADKKLTLYQDTSASWIWQVGEEKIYDPILKKNMEYFKLHSGLDKPYYEYSDIHYKILTGQDGGSFMGYRVYDGSEKVVASGNRAFGWADVTDGRVGLTAAVRWFWQMFPKSIELDGRGRVTLGLLPRQWRRGHFFDGKTHRTHELLYRFHGAEKPELAEASVKAFNEPLVPYCGFDWYLNSGACNLFARPDRKNWPIYEAQMDTAVHVGINPKINTALDSSIATEREKQDAFGWQHFGDTSKRDFRGHSQFQEFDTSRCLMMHYWRTGDPAFFREAEILARFLANIPCFGGGYGHQHPESSHNWIQGLFDYWCMSGLPEAKEGIDAMRGYYKGCQSNKAANWHYNGRNAAYALNGLRQMFEVTGEKEWLDALNLNIRDCKRRTRAISGFYGGNPGWFMSHVFVHALGRYALLTGDEDAVDLTLGLSGHFKPFSDGGQGTGLACADCYAYCTMLTGDPHYLKVAVKNNSDASSSSVRKHGPAYRTGSCSSKTWSGSVGGYGQVFFYAVKNWKPGDTAPPAPVTDLKCEPGPEPGSVKLTWTNTGDDGKTGKAHKVQVKYAPGEIVEYIHWGRYKKIDGKPADPKDVGKVNFWYCTNATGEPAPTGSGTKQGFTATGLPSGKTLWFAVKLHDEAGNRSKVSNSMKVTVP